MPIEQLSVYIKNKLGGLREVTEILAESNVNIIAHAVADTTDFGVLRMIVDQSALAERALRDQGHVVSRTPVVATIVPDQPGGFNHLLTLLEKETLSFSYTYSIGNLPDGTAVNIFHFEDINQATEKLVQNGVRLLDDIAKY